MRLEDVLSTSVAAGASNSLSQLLGDGPAAHMSAALSKTLSEAEKRYQDSLQRTVNATAAAQALSSSGSGGGLALPVNPRARAAAQAAVRDVLLQQHTRGGGGGGGGQPGAYDALYNSVAQEYPTETELLNRRLMTDVIAYVKMLNKTLHFHMAESSRLDDTLQDIAERYFPDAFFNEDEIDGGNFHYAMGAGLGVGVSATAQGVPLAQPTPPAVATGASRAFAQVQAQARSRSPSPEAKRGLRRPASAMERSASASSFAPGAASSSALGPLKSLRFAPGGTAAGTEAGMGGFGPRPASALPSSTGARGPPFRRANVLAIPPGMRTSVPLDVADSIVGSMPARKVRTA